MKQKILRITDISEIDTSRVSVFDMNNRYIDGRGNIYGLKFNRLTKKIEVIKLIRTHTDEAQFVQHRIIQKKIKTQQIQEKEQSEWHNDDTEDIPATAFSPRDAVERIISLIGPHRERLKGIIMNIKNSNAFTRDNKTESIELDNIFRNLDIDGIQQFEKIENYHRELTGYPRSITYYMAKLDPRSRDIVDSMGTESDRVMRYIFFYEMNNSITAMYRNLKKILVNLTEFLSTKDIESMKNLTSFEKQSFEDANTSIENTLLEIDDVLDSLLPMDDFLHNPENL